VAGYRLTSTPDGRDRLGRHAPGRTSRGTLDLESLPDVGLASTPRARGRCIPCTGAWKGVAESRHRASGGNTRRQRFERTYGDVY